MTTDEPTSEGAESNAFASATVDRIRQAGGAWDLPGGRLLLPRVFGLCRGVKRALAMLGRAVEDHRQQPGRLFLLGEIIHNPWVNAFFEARGVRSLTRDQHAELEAIITADDCAIIPAFGVPLPIERRLKAIGCELVDTSCGDVRRLWAWAEKAAGQGYGVVIFGRADHDETVVTRSRLAEVGGRYVVVGDLAEARRLCDLIAGGADEVQFARMFDRSKTNAESLAPFERVAQVSQTTMLYDDTTHVRRLLREAFASRFGAEGGQRRLLFEPTVCQATQDRQAAAIELCESKLDLAVVVGGFGSSNTRHLYELARGRVPSWFIEDADAIRSAREILAMDPAGDGPVVISDWLPERRPLRVGVLAGASSPDVVVGGVLEALAELLS